MREGARGLGGCERLVVPVVVGAREVAVKGAGVMVGVVLAGVVVEAE